MSERLEQLAESHGIQVRYRSEMGEPMAIDAEAQGALLQALRVDPESGERGRFAELQHAPRRRCALPERVRGQRRWGVTCQLYALRSRRSLGLGDFADLGHLAEIAAAVGADFVGVNPMHALFMADPGRYSPYSPSTRRFINPFYVAVDAVEGGAEAIETLRAAEPALFEGLDGELVDYMAAGTLKRRLLRELFEVQKDALRGDPALAAFREKGGDALAGFALFEALSEARVAAGEGAGWHNWPAELHDRSGEAVRRFERENVDAVLFHGWLQFLADQQLAAAQERALAAGMAVGLYLDFAVGVSPDGAETWADPQVTVRAARVGSPPDMFNSDGQDWGLAPLSPDALAERNYAPLVGAYESLMDHAGAIRIDHAMGLARLWWIPETSRSSGGGYVRYPLGDMIDALAEVSERRDCLVIGEDLGTVPEGFRETAEEAAILSYKVLYFERWEDGLFKATTEYPELSLACISTHDLAALAGWWHGSDIRLRSETGRQSEAHTARDLASRDRDRKALLGALRHENLLSPHLAGLLDGGDPLPERLDEELAIAIHRFAARTRSMLFAVQVEDMILSERQPNLPGTTDEYPNWRIRSEVLLEDLAADERFQAMARALRDERPQLA
ncbi:4-alpha-glucanotransferase [Aureimonas jatrophae]|uniref:4-alpha-glucanotransferase n=1 Tax=Aureimonas jatrophae TaxID=1166073 RepID=A0A1H0HLL1_9HYPH|nr:4-alpha-glucanotransferase [Aureimonas jatrophae]MBB3950657.1 4-alpha-glucanotransferase [Aureimonas jatrophae]SDO20065.1 4-alpha-glucanotransferase [Aureimonas jatrophae]